MSRDHRPAEAGHDARTHADPAPRRHGVQRPGPAKAGHYVRVATILACILAAACQSKASGDASETIIGLERTALDRWGKGDPQGYFDIMAAEETYFDPTIEKRLDGVEALKTLIAPYGGKIRIERAEMIAPKVQQQGDLAVLTFNLVSHGAQVGDGPKGDVRWNSTEVYRRFDGHWRIVHSHWSYTKPQLKERPAE